jgi:hypothetical protein
MKKIKPIFHYDKETGCSTCIIETKYGKFSGTACCHPDDMDMASEKVGCEIAYSRAAIDSLKYERDNVIKPSLKALKQLYYSMNRSKKFNPKSYEYKMLKRQIECWEFDLAVINDMINTERTWIRDYINTKEALYQNIRANRNNGQN